MKLVNEHSQPGGQPFAMTAEFSPEDAASLIKMQLGNLDPLRPERDLVEKVRWYVVSLSKSRYGRRPQMRKLIGNLEDHLTTLGYPVDADAEPLDTTIAHAGALSIANGIIDFIAT